MEKRILLFLVFILALNHSLGASSFLKNLKVEKEEDYAPVIGILTQPWEEESPFYPRNATSITSSYAKFIESVGGRTIPIHYTHTFEHVEELMKKINGILFTGGDLNLTDPKTGKMHPYTELSNFIYNKAKELNDAGDHFPIWGTCQGHQMMMLLESQNNYIIKSTPRWYKPDNLKLQDYKNSSLLSSFPDTFLNKLKEEELTYNIHYYGIHLEDFKQLEAFYSVVSTNTDDQGTEYVSMTEAREYPFFTVQFHPERNVYNYSKKNIPHSLNAVEFATLLAQKFLEEANLSDHRIDSYDQYVGYSIQRNGDNVFIVPKLVEEKLKGRKNLKSLEDLTDEYVFIHDYP